MTVLCTKSCNAAWRSSGSRPRLLIRFTKLSIDDLMFLVWFSFLTNSSYLQESKQFIKIHTNRYTAAGDNTFTSGDGGGGTPNEDVFMRGCDAFKTISEFSDSSSELIKGKKRKRKRRFKCIGDTHRGGG